MNDQWQEHSLMAAGHALKMNQQRHRV